MKDSIHPRRESRSRPTRMLTAAALLSGVLVAGCGGSSPARPLAAADASAPTSTVAAGDSTAGAASTGAERGPPGGPRVRKVHARQWRDQLPGPETRAGALTSTPPGRDLIARAKAGAGEVREVDSRRWPSRLGFRHPPHRHWGSCCRIAVCMRQHGVPQFPDPRTSMPSNLDPGESGEITDFDGAILLFPATINMQAPAYRQALTACGAPPLGLPTDGSRGRHQQPHGQPARLHGAGDRPSTSAGARGRGGGGDRARHPIGFAAGYRHPGQRGGRRDRAAPRPGRDRHRVGHARPTPTPRPCTTVSAGRSPGCQRSGS